MSDQDPHVLVVMPTLGERLDTLPESIRSATEQAGVTIRLVVVVPAGATEARRIAATAGATVVDDPGRGLSAAVNAGLAAHADEEFYAWLNDDDFYLPGALATLSGMLQLRPDAAVAYGACVYIDETGRTIGASRAGDLAYRLQPWGPNLIPQPASLTRMDAVVSAGSYDETLRFAMDLDMFLRLRKHGAFVSTKLDVATFRWHADSLSVGGRSHSVTEAQAVKRRYLSRRARRIAPLWDLPVRWATHAAGMQVSRRARRIGAAS